MAYPIVGQAKFERAKHLMRSASILLSVDDFAVAQALAESMLADYLEAEVLLLIDTGFHRCGVGPEKAVDVALAIARLRGVQFRGIITHEGHAYRAPGNEGLSAMALEAGKAMVGIANEIRARGVPVDVVSVGSTATAKLTTRVHGITHVRPGIYVCNDYGQVLRGVVDLSSCAARVVATVVSHNAPDRAILDAGSKALSSDTLSFLAPGLNSGYGLVADLPGWSLFRLSEEHGWLRWEGGGEPTPLEIGQRVQILPNHICTVFHALGESVIVEDGEFVATWRAAARDASQ